VKANNAQFIDPCQGVYKYLKVTYNCIRPSGKIYLY